MNDAAKYSDDGIRWSIPPFPQYVLSDYRLFEENERHITRICNEYILLLMFGGELHFTENGKEVSLAGGDWYIQKPFLPQSANRPSNKADYYYIHFTYPEAERQNMASMLRIPIRGTCHPQLYQSYFRQMTKFPFRAPLDTLLMQTVFLEFFHFFLRTAVISRSPQQDLAQKMSEYLRKKYSQALTTSDLTDQFHYSADYLRRIFQTEWGCTPAAYLNQLRIERAKTLLANTDASVEEIAAEVGYQDPSTFFRNFRKNCGLGPSRWRMAARGIYDEAAQQ